MALNEEKKLEYAWNWFDYHASQRMTTFNFFLILIGVVVVGYLKCIELVGKSHSGMEQSGMEKIWWALALATGFFGIIISVAFWFLDIRNEELVNYGRNALDLIESSSGISIRLGDTCRNDLDKSSDFISRLLPKSWRKTLIRHHFLLRSIIIFSAIMFLIATIFAAYFLISSCETTQEVIIFK